MSASQKIAIVMYWSSIVLMFACTIAGNGFALTLAAVAAVAATIVVKDYQ